MRNFLIKIIVFILILLDSGAIQAQMQLPEPEKSLVNWLSLKEAMEKNRVQPKPIIIDFYTGWCGWCKVMMKTTYSDSALAQYINTYFYSVKFDAEGKDTVEFLGKKYYPTSKEPKAPHELAIKMLSGKLMYPSTVFLNGFDKEKNEFKLNMLAAGYLERKKIEPMLVFSVENVFHNCSYDDFRKYYEETYYDSTLSKKLEKLKWLTPKEVFSSTLPRKKKTLLFIHTDWCNACRVMKSTSFIDSSVSRYLDKYFDIADFNADYSDTLLYKNQKFINPRTQEMPFHQLAVGLCRNSLVLPSLVILDENLDFIDLVPSYLSPAFLTDITQFFGEGINKKKSWMDFMADKEKAK